MDPETKSQTAQYRLKDLVLYFLRLGALGFGGPIALVGYMQRDLVEDRRWITREDYAEGLALAQLSPGPLAAQLAIYLGWLKGGIFGSNLVSIAFILPSFLMVVALAVLYLSLWRPPVDARGLLRRGCRRDRRHRSQRREARAHDAREGPPALAILHRERSVTVWLQSEFVWVFLACGAASVLVKTPPKILKSGSASIFIAEWPAALFMGLHGLAPAGTLWKIAWYFTKAGAFVFGSGLAIVPFLYGGVVQEFHWLNDRQFLDAVAVAMITPGPVVITVGFIGYLVAGLPGAVVAALGTFLPCYLFTVIPAPFFHRSARNPRIKALVEGITATTTGAIAGAAIVLGRRAIFDIPTALIASVTLVLLVKARKIPEPILIIAAGIVGLILGGRGT